MASQRRAADRGQLALAHKITAFLDPGSAIEDFGQKISLHNKLLDLDMKFRNLDVAVSLNLGP